LETSGEWGDVHNVNRGKGGIAICQEKGRGIRTKKKIRQRRKAREIAGRSKKAGGSKNA